MKQIFKKVVLLGNYNVGKTSLINRFVFDKFSSNYKETIGVKISKSCVNVSTSYSLNMIIWDIGGGLKNENLPKSYYLGAGGIIYVVDLTKTDQYENCRKEISELQLEFPQVPIVTVGNKIDLIQEDFIVPIINSTKIEFNMLSSAKTGKNVYQLFLKLAQSMLQINHKAA